MVTATSYGTAFINLSQLGDAYLASPALPFGLPKLPLNRESSWLGVLAFSEAGRPYDAGARHMADLDRL